MSPRLIASAMACGAILTAALGLYWKGRLEGAARERPKVEAAQARAAVASLETQGERQTAQRVEVVVRQREAAAQSVTRLTREALNSEDAHAPLAHDRLARLRAHDDELCLQAELAGCPAPGDAGGSDGLVRAVPPAGLGDRR